MDVEGEADAVPPIRPSLNLLAVGPPHSPQQPSQSTNAQKLDRHVGHPIHTQSPSKSFDCSCSCTSELRFYVHFCTTTPPRLNSAISPKTWALSDNSLDGNVVMRAYARPLVLARSTKA